MVYGYASLGYEGMVVTIEVDMSNSIPGLEIVGLPSSEVREARERVKIAIRASGFHWPSKRIIVNLSPADIKKHGSGFDLSIALAILAHTGQIRSTISFPIMALGELSFNGDIRPVRQCLAATMCAREKGISHFIVAKENQRETISLKESECYAISSLKELKTQFHFTNNALSRSTEVRSMGSMVSVDEYQKNPKTTISCLEDTLAGLSYCDDLKRVLQIAAAGRHHLHLSGPPGTGKTSSAMKISSLLPELTYEESIELSKIYACGAGYHASYTRSEGDEDAFLLKERPIRMPHHTASIEGIIGSTSRSVPGEVSLAHTGVLILDEAPEFKASVLQSLREPMDSQEVHISRAGQKWDCPADFQLVITSNLCPCGNLGKKNESKHWCLCSEKEIFRYWKRVGGAIWDRIDMKFSTKSDVVKEESVETRITQFERMRGQVANAIHMQKQRFKEKRHDWNARCPSGMLESSFFISRTIAHDMHRIVRDHGSSERGRLTLARVSRTIADLEGSDIIHAHHVDEAKELVFSITPSHVLNMMEEIALANVMRADHFVAE